MKRFTSIQKWAGFRNGLLMSAQDFKTKPFRICIYESKEEALTEHQDVRLVTITWETVDVEETTLASDIRSKR